MKKIVVFLFLFANSHMIMAQFEGFVKEGTIWRLMYKKGGLQMQPVTNSPTNIFLANDTVIGSLTYKIVKPDWGVHGNMGHYIREDSSGKVYLRGDTSKEKILYDFALNVGDSFPHFFTNSSSEYIHVGYTDSLFVDGKYLKVIHFTEVEDWFYWNSFTEIIWIEGIGNVNHPFADYEVPCESCGWNVLCSKSIDLEWEYVPGECQYLVTPELKIKNELNIYPNPFVDFVQFSSDEDFDELQIFDITGNLVHRECNLGNALNLSQLSTGLLLFNFYKNGYLVTSQRLIKK